MLSIDICGGLGNQLFQIFCVIAHSIETNDKFIFPYSLQIADRSTYWNTMLVSLIRYTDYNNKINFKSFDKYEELAFHYNDLPKFEKDTILHGYYQSYKYFEKHQDKIYDLINLFYMQDVISDRFKNYLVSDKPILCIHFRIGDYLYKQSHHTILDINYYIRALQNLMMKMPNTNFQVLYFCEKINNSFIDYERVSVLKRMFKNLDFIKVSDDISDYEQLLIMTMNKYFIIANSSFSYFGAYMSQHKDKIVYYPEKNWFGPALADYDVSDMCPESWIAI
jgi:hypothetical protein